MKLNLRISIAVLLTVLLVACHSTDPLYHPEKAQGWESRTLPAAENSPLVHRAFLIGDVGQPRTDGTDPILNLLKRKLDAAGKESSVTFLGNNVYPKGLPDEEDSTYLEAKEYLDAQLAAVQAYAGKVVFIPGNHDYNKSGRGGHEAGLRQEKYVEKYLEAGDTFLPNGGCPGPEVVPLADGVVMLVINSEWWLTRHQNRKTKGCEIKTELEFITELNEVLKDHRMDRIVVEAHHPIQSLGKHGGHFPLKEHLFPLRLVNEKLLIPFPVLGSLYPYYRKFLGHPQDIIHPRYQLYIDN
ncbi:MAG: metallophosphoesterase, partial [Salibacteraceae bacterium]